MVTQVTMIFKIIFQFIYKHVIIVEILLIMPGNCFQGKDISEV